MALRRVMLGVTIVLLVLGSALAGTIAADWPYLQRLLVFSRSADVATWPAAPLARIDGRGTEAIAPGGDAIDPRALEAAAQWAAARGSVALLVLHRGRLVLERYAPGQAPDAPFDGAGMSRSLIGLAYGAAVDRGLLALDDPASRWLDEWRGDPRGAITLRQLLQDVSGLDEHPLDAAAAAPLPTRGGLAGLLRLARLWSDRDARLVFGNDAGATALGFPLADAPGTRFARSNAGPQLLVSILERATGSGFERWFEEQVWRPLGAGTGEFRLDRASGMPLACCGFRATPRDWLRLGALLAGDGAVAGRQVLPRGWVAQLAGGTSNVNPRFGLQVWSGRATRGLREYLPGSGIGVRHGEDFLVDDVVWMEGEGGGSSLWAFPGEQLVILNLGRASPGLDGSVLPNTILRGLRPDDGVMRAPAAIAGTPPR